jgi:four helix bundle suffix protein
MTDQMVQAARSGVRNLSEASGAAATSKKSEMTLTNVARASLRDELLKDVQSFMHHHGLAIWPKEDPRTLEMRRRLYHDHAPWVKGTKGKVVLTGLKGLADFVREAEPELAGNAMLCVLHQVSCLILRQLQGQMRQFEESGGFTENLSRRRRRRWDK